MSNIPPVGEKNQSFFGGLKDTLKKKLQGNVEKTIDGSFKKNNTQTLSIEAPGNVEQNKMMSKTDDFIQKDNINLANPNDPASKPISAVTSLFSGKGEKEIEVETNNANKKTSKKTNKKDQPEKKQEKEEEIGNVAAVKEFAKLVKDPAAFLDKIVGALAKDGGIINIVAVLLTGKTMLENQNGLTQGAVNALQEAIVGWIHEWIGPKQIEELKKENPDVSPLELINYILKNNSDKLIGGVVDSLSQAIINALLNEADKKKLLQSNKKEQNNNNIISDDDSSVDRSSSEEGSGSEISEEDAQSEAQLKIDLMKAIAFALVGSTEIGEDGFLGTLVGKTASIASKALFNEDVSQNKGGIVGQIKKDVDDRLERVEKMVAPITNVLPEIQKTLIMLNEKVNKFEKENLPQVMKTAKQFGDLAEKTTSTIDSIGKLFKKTTFTFANEYSDRISSIKFGEDSKLKFLNPLAALVRGILHLLEILLYPIQGILNVVVPAEPAENKDEDTIIDKTTIENDFLKEDFEDVV